MEIERIDGNARYGEKLVKCAFCGIRRPEGDMKGWRKPGKICKDHKTTGETNPNPELDKVFNGLDREE